MIQTHVDSFIQSPILIGNIKGQFLLAILKSNSYWQHQNPILIGNIKVQFLSPIFIGNIKAQFLLATSKPNFHWQYQNPILIGNIKAQFSLALLYQKEKSPRLSTLGKEKNIMLKCYRGKKGPWQSSYEETHWELSWGLCSHIINSWNTWTLFASWHP